MDTTDYYEFLQISPNAEPITIQRVYRFLASRLHPDNPETGDPEKFLLLKQAYDVLSDPERRAQYDATYKNQAPQPPPLSTAIDFMDNLEGESNRRLAVLAVLYLQRRINPYSPEVPLAEIERRMGFPRDYLHFTLWYLKNKNYITLDDSAESMLTVLGVDYVEANRADIPVLSKLLTPGGEAPAKEGMVATKALPGPRQPLVESGGSDGSSGGIISKKR